MNITLLGMSFFFAFSHTCVSNSERVGVARWIVSFLFQKRFILLYSQCNVRKKTLQEMMWVLLRSCCFLHGISLCQCAMKYALHCSDVLFEVSFVAMRYFSSLRCVLMFYWPTPCDALFPDCSRGLYLSTCPLWQCHLLWVNGRSTSRCTEVLLCTFLAILCLRSLQLLNEGSRCCHFLSFALPSLLFGKYDFLRSGAPLPAGSENFQFRIHNSCESATFACSSFVGSCTLRFMHSSLNYKIPINVWSECDCCQGN